MCTYLEKEWYFLNIDTHGITNINDTGFFWSMYSCMYSCMRRLRLVGSLKLQVSFSKKPCKRDYILQKRPIIWRSLLIVATPYEWMNECIYLYVYLYAHVRVREMKEGREEGRERLRERGRERGREGGRVCVREKMQSSTGWRRLIGSPKLQIIFHKRATKYRSLLRKMTYKDKGSYESSPPSTSWCERASLDAHRSFFFVHL